MKNKVVYKSDHVVIEVVAKGELFEVLMDIEDFERYKKEVGTSIVMRHEKGEITYPAFNTKRNSSEKRKNVLLHRWIMGFPEGKLIDHQDHNKRNARRSNLRLCTKQENNRHNQRANPNRNIYWNKARGVYYLQFRDHGKSITCGRTFKEHELEEARELAKKMRAELYGEFAGASQ